MAGNECGEAGSRGPQGLHRGWHFFNFNDYLGVARRDLGELSQTSAGSAG